MLVDDTAFELYSKMYFTSLDLRERMAARAQIPLAAILALLGAQSYLFLNELFEKRGYELAFYAVFLTLAFAFVCRAAVLFFKVLSGQIYKVIPAPLALEKYRGKCLAQYAANLDGDSEQWHDQWAATTVRGEMATHLADCATHNGEINDLRSEFSWRAHRSLMISVALTAIVFIVGNIWTFYSNRGHSTETSSVIQGEVASIDSISRRGAALFLSETSLRSKQDESK
ncbi:MAG: hypothetical protein WBF88_04425 [Pusillimonas sp.]